MTLRQLSLTQSTTNVFGASSRNRRPSSIACNGRIHVLNCCSDNSISSARRHFVQRDGATAESSATVILFAVGLGCGPGGGVSLIRARLGYPQGPRRFAENAPLLTVPVATLTVSGFPKLAHLFVFFDAFSTGIRSAMKRTYQPSKLRRARTHGFRARMATRGGQKVINSRRAKGRARLCP